MQGWLHIGDIVAAVCAEGLSSVGDIQPVTIRAYSHSIEWRSSDRTDGSRVETIGFTLWIGTPYSERSATALPPPSFSEALSSRADATAVLADFISELRRVLRGQVLGTWNEKITKQAGSWTARTVTESYHLGRGFDWNVARSLTCIIIPCTLSFTLTVKTSSAALIPAVS